MIIDTTLNQLEKEALEGMPDVETSWAKFETALNEKYPKKRKIPYAKFALVASVALALLLSTQSEKVTAFKNEIFQWIVKDAGQGAIVSEVENPIKEPGVYTGLSFEDAQEKTVFHLLKPEYLPAGIKPNPEVELEVYEYPIVSVKLEFEGDQNKTLIILEENSPGNMQTNTFVPENVKLKEMKIENRNVLVFSREGTTVVQWAENGIHYSIRTYGIKEEDVFKVIKTLN